MTVFDEATCVSQTIAAVLLLIAVMGVGVIEVWGAGVVKRATNQCQLVAGTHVSFTTLSSGPGLGAMATWRERAGRDDGCRTNPTRPPTSCRGRRAGDPQQGPPTPCPTS